MKSLTKPTSTIKRDGSKIEQRFTESHNDRTIIVAVVFLCMVTILISSFLPVSQEPTFVTCPSRRFFNVECPGCGLTRGFVALAHGELDIAWKMNPFALLLYPATWAFFFIGVKALSKKSPCIAEKHRRQIERFVVLVAVGLIVHHAIRSF